MRPTTIKSFVFNTKALVFTVMFLVTGNLEAATRGFRPIGAGPVESEWIPKIVGRLFETFMIFVSGVINYPPG